MPPIKPLSPDMLPELARFWNAAFPDQALTEFLLAERVFGPRDASPENSLCYLDDRGGIIALSLIVPPPCRAKLIVPALGAEQDSVIVCYKFFLVANSITAFTGGCFKHVLSPLCWLGV